MNYKALYRVYRPTTFDEVNGQDHIVATLKNIILTNKISHGYLFNGPRGTGKTSVAKIFATALNCIHKNDDFNPCQICIENSNKNIDIIEMDAASNNSVDDVRRLNEELKSLPLKGEYRIYIIDEVHMFTKSAFNALLKSLEEPPKHVIFIFATTESHKIPNTILSRVQRFNFRRISNDVIIGHLANILEKEKINYEPKSLVYIASLASGSFRDALSIADQASIYGQGKITLKNLITSFGISSNESVINLINNTVFNLYEAINNLDEFKKNGADPEYLLISLINIIKDFIVFKKTNNLSFLALLSFDEIDLIKIDLQKSYFIIEEAMKTLEFLRISEMPFDAIEILIIKVHKKIGQEEEKENENEKLKIIQNSIDNEKIKDELLNYASASKGSIGTNTIETSILETSEDEEAQSLTQILNSGEMDLKLKEKTNNSWDKTQNHKQQSNTDLISKTNEIITNLNENEASISELDQNIITSEIDNNFEDDNFISTGEFSLENYLKNQDSSAQSNQRKIEDFLFSAKNEIPHETNLTKTINATLKNQEKANENFTKEQDSSVKEILETLKIELSKKSQEIEVDQGDFYTDNSSKENEIIDTNQFDYTTKEKLKTSDLFFTEEKPILERVKVDNLYKKTTEEIKVDKTKTTTTTTESQDVVIEKVNEDKYSVDEVINMFLQHDNANYREESKMAIQNANNFLANPRFRKYAHFFSAVHCVAANKNFVVVSSEINLDIFNLLESIEKFEFKNFINELYGYPKYVFPITESLWKMAKIKWQDIKNKKIPIPEIKKIEIENADKKANQFFSKIFGNITTKKRGE